MMEQKQFKVNIEQLLKDGYPVQLTPRGSSMFPFIRQNKDSVILEPVDSHSLHRGDVALYRRSSKILVLHRVHHRKNGTYYMLGDNQVEIEGPILPEQVCGKLRYILRNGRKISSCQPLYVLESRLWLLFRPLRPYIKALFRRMKKLFRIGKRNV